MQIEESANLVMPFLQSSEDQIIKQFQEVKDFDIFGDGDYSSFLSLGKRKDRVLLVAHIDTVFNDSPHIKIAQQGNILYSENRERGLDKNKCPFTIGFGIGADDRAGVATLWHLRNSGHSILLTSGEESGCLGSAHLMSLPDAAEIIQEHNFVVQFDRRGNNDIVFYDVGTKKFKDYVKAETGYIPMSGSYTDICVLCENICGVNMSIGYKNEHSSNEILNLRWFTNTINTAEKWLSKKLPEFRR